jgi:hypothetical protein
MGMGDHAESCSCSWPPNNSLKPWTNAPAHYAGRPWTSTRIFD